MKDLSRSIELNCPICANNQFKFDSELESTTYKCLGTVMMVGGGVGIAALFPILRALKEADNKEGHCGAPAIRS